MVLLVGAGAGSGGATTLPVSSYVKVRAEASTSGCGTSPCEVDTDGMSQAATLAPLSASAGALSVVGADTTETTASASATWSSVDAGLVEIDFLIDFQTGSLGGVARFGANPLGDPIWLYSFSSTTGGTFEFDYTTIEGDLDPINGFGPASTSIFFLLLDGAYERATPNASGTASFSFGPGTHLAYIKGQSGSSISSGNRGKLRQGDFAFTITPVPEPASAAAMGLGLLVLALARGPRWRAASRVR